MKKFVIVYPSKASETVKRAVEILCKTLQSYTSECPICLCGADAIDAGTCRVIYLGTKDSCEYIKKNSAVSLFVPEEYSINVKNEVVMIEGFDDAGVLYGAIDFYNRYVIKFVHKNNDMSYCINFFEHDTLPEFEYRSAPTAKERGLWT